MRRPAPSSSSFAVGAAPSRSADSIVFRRGDRRVADGARRHRAAPAHERRAALRVAVGGRRRHDRRLRHHRPGCTADGRGGRARRDPDGGRRPPTRTRRPRHPPTSASRPTARKIAYDEAIDGDVTTSSDAAATVPRQTLGQDGLIAPSWIGNSRLLLSRDVSADGEGTDVRARTTSAPTTPRSPGSATRASAGRPASTPPPPATAAAWRSSRTIRRRANGTPTRVVLRLLHGDDVPLRARVGGGRHLRLGVALPSRRTGRTVAWAESDGIHVAGSDCGDERVVTLPGAWEPYWSARYTEPTAGGRRHGSPSRCGPSERPRTGARAQARDRRAGDGRPPPATVTVRVRGATPALPRHAATYTVRVKVAWRRFTVGSAPVLKAVAQAARRARQRRGRGTGAPSAHGESSDCGTSVDDSVRR